MRLRDYLKSLPRGGRTDFAREIGVSPAYLYQMSVGVRPVRAQLCRQIERASGGLVSVHDSRPDVFGPKPRAAA